MRPTEKRRLGIHGEKEHWGKKRLVRVRVAKKRWNVKIFEEKAKLKTPLQGRTLPRVKTHSS